MAQCKHIKGDGNQCGRHAVAGRDYCTVHGGLTAIGIAAPNYKHGRYSRFLPERLAGRYAEIMGDTELLSLRDDIALVDTRIQDILPRVDSGEAGQVWARAGKTLEEYNEAMRVGDGGKAALLMTGLTALISRGIQEYAAWAEIIGLLEYRRKFTESERKRLLEMQMVVDVDRLNVFVGALLDIIKRNVSDRTVLMAIAQEVQALMSRSHIESETPERQPDFIEAAAQEENEVIESVAEVEPVQVIIEVEPEDIFGSSEDQE